MSTGIGVKGVRELFVYLGADGHVYAAGNDGSRYLLSQGAAPPDPSGGGVPEAPTDGSQYGRQSASWTRVSVPVGSQSELTLSINGTSVTLAIDSSTGDLLVYNTDRSKTLNVTQGFVGTNVVVVPPTNPAAPVITSISPSSVPAGSPDTIVTFTGTGFTSTMQAGFGDHLMSWTTQMQSSVFDSSTQIRGTLGANLLANPTEFFLFLINSGAPDSNNLPFEVV